MNQEMTASSAAITATMNSHLTAKPSPKKTAAMSNKTMSKAMISSTLPAGQSVTSAVPGCRVAHNTLALQLPFPHVEIRAADAGDWPQIYRFFAAIVQAGETYAYPEGLAADDAEAIWMEPPPAHVVAAADGERVIGSAKMGPNRPGRGAHVATASFMVDPAASGRGVGQALGEYVLAWARSNGYRGIQFNAVVETNERAVRLWHKLGFRIVGTVPGAFRHPEHGYVGLHVMYLDLTAE
jgi:GNAT superfamily N-acetyltransferase